MRWAGSRAVAVVALLVLLVLLVADCGSSSSPAGPSDAGSDGGPNGGGDAGCTGEGGAQRTWSLVTAPTSADLSGVFEPEAGDVWVQGDVLYRGRAGAALAGACVASFCGGSRSQLGSCGPMAPAPCSSGTASPITGSGLWGSSSNDMWAGNVFGSVMHWDGQAWTSLFTGDNRAAGVFWGTGSTDVWGVDINGNGYTGHYDGTAWAHLPNETLGAIWAADADHYWGSSPSSREVQNGTLGPDAGAVSFWSGASAFNDGGSPFGTPVFTTGAALFGLWGVGPTELWAVGAAGTIVHGSGGQWIAVQSPTTNDLYWIWGSTAANVWAVGAKGTILHYDGQAWSSVTSPTTNDLHGVAGHCDDAWAVGAAGTLLHLH